MKQQLTTNTLVDKQFQITWFQTKFGGYALVIFKLFQEIPVTTFIYLPWITWFCARLFLQLYLKNLSFQVSQKIPNVAKEIQKDIF